MAIDKNRITAEMTMEDVLITMAEGNPSALTCLLGMITSDPRALIDILLFDSMGIYGTKIYMLWNDCCDRDMEKFKKTIQAFREGKFSEREIHENLSRVRARPFI